MTKTDVGFEGSLRAEAGRDLFLSRGAPKTAQAFMAHRYPSVVDSEWSAEHILQTALVEIGPYRFVDVFLDAGDSNSAAKALERCQILDDAEREVLTTRLIDLLIEEKSRRAEGYLRIAQGVQKERILDIVLERLDQYLLLREQVFIGESGNLLASQGLNAVQQRRVLDRAIGILLNPEPRPAENVERDIAYFIARVETPADLRTKLMEQIVDRGYVEAALKLLSGKVYPVMHKGKERSLSNDERTELLGVLKRAGFGRRLGMIVEPYSEMPWHERLVLLWG